MKKWNERHVIKQVLVNSKTHPLESAKSSHKASDAQNFMSNQALNGRALNEFPLRGSQIRNFRKEDQKQIIAEYAKHDSNSGKSPGLWELSSKFPMGLYPPTSAPRPYWRSQKLFFKPLLKFMNRDEVYTGLSKLGKIIFLKVPFNMKKRKNLGYGYVVFESRILSLQLLSRTVTVEFAGATRELTFERFSVLKQSKAFYTSSPPVNELVKGNFEDQWVESSPVRKEHHRKPTSRAYHESQQASAAERHSGIRFNLRPAL